MATNKTKATIYLDKTVWDRFKVVMDEMPNQSASSFIENWMRVSLPHMEKVVAAYKDGDHEAIVKLTYVGLGEQFAHLDVIRRESEMGGESSGG